MAKENPLKLIARIRRRLASSWHPVPAEDVRALLEVLDNCRSSLRWSSDNLRATIADRNQFIASLHRILPSPKTVDISDRIFLLKLKLAEARREVRRLKKEAK